MATHIRIDAVRILVAIAALVVIAVGAWWAYDRYTRDYTVSAPKEYGPAVTQIVSARLAGTSALKVADLSGTVQSTASDVRGLGWLRSDQIVKMPYSVSYFVDVSDVGPGNIEWHPDTRTLIVDAPDVTVAEPNTDEGRRTLVQTTGIFVTRKAAEELSRQTSLHAGAAAKREASAPQRIAQAREYARAAIAKLLVQPLVAAGMNDARVIVTFPPERTARSRERWDTTRSVEQVLTNQH